MIDLLPRHIETGTLSYQYAMPDGSSFRLMLGDNIVHPYLGERAWPLLLALGTQEPCAISWIIGDAGDVSIQYVEEMIFRHINALMVPYAEPNAPRDHSPSA